MNRLNELRPVYPQTLKNSDGSEINCFGISLREYFAGLAMQGILANPEYKEETNDMLAYESVLKADALIKQLETTKP